MSMPKACLNLRYGAVSVLYRVRVRGMEDMPSKLKDIDTNSGNSKRKVISSHL